MAQATTATVEGTALGVQSVANLRRRHFFIPKLYKWHLGTLNLAYLTSRQA